MKERNEEISAEDDWTWKNTLERLQHIDNIIETVVSRAIALNVGILAGVAAIILKVDSLVGWQAACMIIIGIAWIAINIIHVIQLARQECIRKYYFKNIPQKIYDEVLPRQYRKNDERRFLCWLGIIPYVLSWIWILVIIIIMIPIIIIIITKV